MRFGVYVIGAGIRFQVVSLAVVGSIPTVHPKTYYGDVVGSNPTALRGHGYVGQRGFESHLATN